LIEVNSIEQLEKLLGVDLSRYYPDMDIDHQGIQLSNLIENIIKLIVKADALAIEDACKLISQDPHLPFGKLIKSDLSRALKKSAEYITNQDREKIVKVTASLLSLEFCPRETEDYCKLVRKLGNNYIKATLSLAKPNDKKSILLASGLESVT